MVLIVPRMVYLIRHNKTNRIYIGSSSNPERRFKTHLYNLRSGCHIVEDMQSDYNNYGEDYSFLILDEIKTWEEREKEYEWMKKYDSTNRAIGYNYKDHKKLYRKNQSDKRSCIQAIKKNIEKCDDLELLHLILTLLYKVERRKGYVGYENSYANH